MNLHKKLKENSGNVIIEATIVFPVMFLVLFFIIYLGNIYYGRAQLDDVAMRYCIKGAQSISDPLHYDMETYSTIPMDEDVQPYRFIFGEIPGGSIDKIENKIIEEIEDEIDNNLISFFNNMKISFDKKPKAEFNNYVLYGTFTVEIEYSIPFPIKFWNKNTFPVAELKTRAEVSVNDIPEFIRNTDMVIDLVDGTKFGNKIESFFKKINDFISKFAQ